MKLAAERGVKEEDDLGSRHVEAWADNPDAPYSRKEVQELVERALTTLPALYRMVVILHDIEQVPTAEAAAALGLSFAAFKSRLQRGRLRLREALVPFSSGSPGRQHMYSCRHVIAELANSLDDDVAAGIRHELEDHLAQCRTGRSTIRRARP